MMWVASWVLGCVLQNLSSQEKSVIGSVCSDDDDR